MLVVCLLPGEVTTSAVACLFQVWVVPTRSCTWTWASFTLLWLHSCTIQNNVNVLLIRIIEYYCQTLPRNWSVSPSRQHTPAGTELWTFPLYRQYIHYTLPFSTKLNSSRNHRKRRYYSLHIVCWCVSPSLLSTTYSRTEKSRNIPWGRKIIYYSACRLLLYRRTLPALSLAV